jgi:hypothetical protein
MKQEGMKFSFVHIEVYGTGDNFFIPRFVKAKSLNYNIHSYFRKSEFKNGEKLDFMKKCQTRVDTKFRDMIFVKKFKKINKKKIS